MSFVYYPDITDKNFYDTIYWKKEFNKTETPIDHRYKTMDEACDLMGIFVMQLSQEFAKNFISSETPYDGVLLMYGTGVGKTCAAIGIAEGLRDYIHKMGKKIYIIASEQICENFKRELYFEDKAVKEKKLHLPPGSLHCAGNRYFPPSDKAGIQKTTAINNNIKKYYSMLGQQAFCNEVENSIKEMNRAVNREAKDIKIEDKSNIPFIIEKFADSLLIIDEAHGLTGVTKE